jgi:hypothetical protein
MKLLVTAVFVAFGVCGCANPIQSTAQTGQKLAAQFVGHNLQDFAIRYGLPSKSMPGPAGGTLYEWRSDVMLHQSPAQTYSTTVVSGNVATATATTTGGAVSAMYCVVQLATDPNNKIVSVSIITDTVGGFAISRCAEVLGL